MGDSLIYDKKIEFKYEWKILKKYPSARCLDFHDNFLSTLFLENELGCSCRFELLYDGSSYKSADTFLTTTFHQLESNQTICATQTFYIGVDNDDPIRYIHDPLSVFTKTANQSVYSLPRKSRLSQYFRRRDTKIVSLTIICELTVINSPFKLSENQFIIDIDKNLFRYNLANHLEELLVSKNFTDITFVLNDEMIKAHKNILAARSLVFNAMFTHDMKEMNDNTVKVDDIQPRIFEQMLNYIYTSQFEMIDGIAMDLWIAADKYQLDDLKLQCRKNLCKKMTLSNASEILIFANLHGDDSLLYYTQTFINKHFQAMKNIPEYKELENNHPQLIVQLYRRLGEMLNLIHEEPYLYE